MTMREIMYCEAIGEAHREEMSRDPTVFAMGQDIRDPWGGSYNSLTGLSSEFENKRVVNTPISEGGVVGLALGAAMTGLRPVVEIMFIEFATRAFDAICLQVAKIRYMTGGQARIPLVIRTQGGGGWASAGHHSNSQEAWYCHAPGLFVAMPSTPYDAKGLLKTAIRMDDPVFFVEHKVLYRTKGLVPDEEYTIPFGVADVKREGNDVTIVATSRMVLFALEAAGLLEKEGISAEVIDPRTLVPLDEETILESVHKTNRLVVVNEGVERCGWAGELAALVQKKAFSDLDSPIERVCTRNVVIPFQEDLERYVLPSVGDIVKAAKTTVGRAA
jgi:pyruvate/2-oxoglutarate/acetoin dehydrogenase E1 component